MNRKGFIFELLLILVIAAVAAVGIYLSISDSRELFMGNENGKYYFNHFRCESMSKKINGTDLKIFSSEAEAKSHGFRPLEGCV